MSQMSESKTPLWRKVVASMALTPAGLGVIAFGYNLSVDARDAVKKSISNETAIKEIRTEFKKGNDALNNKIDKVIFLLLKQGRNNERQNKN